MLKRSLWAAALAAGLSSHAYAQFAQGQRMMLVDEAGRPINSTNALPVAGGSGGGTVTIAPTSSFSVTKTSAIGTTATQVSAADTTNRRTVRNTSSIACEIMPGATAYGTGHPLPAGESFTFDAVGRTTAAIFVGCASAGGSVSVMSY